jgi:hypothetical protein
MAWRWTARDKHDPGLAQRSDGIVNSRQLRVSFHVVQRIDVVAPTQVFLRQPHDQLLQPSDSPLHIHAPHGPELTNRAAAGQTP